MGEEKRKQHFVLVHGACHGAWCWYKVKLHFEASGHRVTALDLAASGINMTRSITDISTCEQYSEPLMQLMTSLPNDEKVVLVGHSLGGLSLAVAMDMFPNKISVSVFVTAIMPDTTHSPSFVMDKSREKYEKKMSEEKRKQHFVLVHGMCHGAWCWYKVKPLLEASGHRVTALDLAACGIDTTRSITEISTCEEYSKPLMQLMTSLPNDEKVVLVGHSFGGLSLAIAMDKFPDKISVSVFVTAFMPDTKHSPSFVEDKFAISNMTPEGWMGTELETYGSENSGLSVLFSTDFMKHRLYQLCPIEDLELGLLLKRPGSLFINELSRVKNFSDKGYGSVPRAYIVCKEDNIISEEHQRWMIDNYPANLVIEMEETDHMPMFCKPQLLSDHLLEIADKFS